MSDRPVAYKRTVTRRESFRLDFEADEVRVALSNVLDEDIPETAAFRVHDDGGATFCWDVDYDVDGPSIQRKDPAPDQDGRTVTPAPDQDGRTMIPIVQLGPSPLDSPSQPSDPPRTEVSIKDASQAVQNPTERVLVVGQDDDPASQVARVEAASVDVSEDETDSDGVVYDAVVDAAKQAIREVTRPPSSTPKPTHNGMEYEGPSQEPGDPVVAVRPSEDTDRDRERLANIASGRGRDRDQESPPNTITVRGHVELSEDPATSFEALIGDDKPAVGHFRDERSSDQEQCAGTFNEGVTRAFRCHLDLGHAGPCGPAEGCEPEDPPKGRRRSW